jgi:methionine-rich copper-binding protein CopC
MSFRFTIAASAFLALAAAAGLAWPHAYPAVAIPADGAVLRESPREIRIQFTEGVEIEFSRIAVKNSSGEKIGQGNLRKPAEDTLAVDLKPLPPGAYTIEWQVLSVDTHVTDGVLRFTVAAGGK